MSSRRSFLKPFWCFSTDDRPEIDASTRKDGSDKPSRVPNASGALRNHRGRADSPSSDSPSDNANIGEELLGDLNMIRNFKTLKEAALKGVKGEPINDKTYLMERIIKLAADLPYRSPKSETLTKLFLTQLWDGLEHPPKSYLGNKFTFRQADGSSNNILWPHVGAAGQPYARTVRPKIMQPVARPDPGVLFDSLLARKAFIPHPNGISSVLFYVASIIIHDIFHTSHKDFAISETSSYLDLAPLYGSSLEEQMLIRTKKDGRLKADCFSDVRILGFPPGVGTLLVFFNRFHNHAVENLAKIDENGRFSSILHPPGRPAPPNGEELYDEALFQTGRLVTTGLYINIILKDYVRSILYLNSVDSKWNLDPRSEEGKSLINNNIPEALGNQVSAEFNLVYRWHSCISERDEKWTEAAYKRIAGDSANMSMSELLMALQKWAMSLPSDPQQRPFHELERQSDGNLPDDKLASIWIDSVNDVAGSFGARHVPQVMRSVEMLGIIQARTWNLASLNEFREYFKLTPHKTFEDINSDPYIVQQLKNLYGHPDHVELYPGIILEDAKKSISPGSGLCTNFTISRAVLSDAVALVRSDRYYTIDYTPQNLTNWGFTVGSYDVSIDYGCVFHKLVLNALPNNFSSNSIFAHYPLVTPPKNQKLLGHLNQAKFYAFEALRAGTAPQMVKIRNTAGAEALRKFSSLWSTRNFAIRGLSSSAGAANQSNIPSFAANLVKQRHWATASTAFFEVAVQRHWGQQEYTIGDHQQIEVLRDVVNVAYAELLRNVLGISDEDLEETGDHFDHRNLARLLSEIFDFGLTAFPTTYLNGSQRRQIVKLAELVETEFRHTQRAEAGQADEILKKRHLNELLAVCGRESMVNLSEAGCQMSEVAWNQVLPGLAMVLVSASRLSAQFMDALLTAKSACLSESRKLAMDATDQSKQAMKDFIGRLTSEHSQITVATTLASRTSSERSGTLPVSTDLQGRIGVYNLSGSIQAVSPELACAAEMHEACMSAVLQIISGLDGLERVPGPQGQLKQVEDSNGSILYLNDKQDEYSACPTMLKVRWKA